MTDPTRLEIPPYTARKRPVYAVIYHTVRLIARSCFGFRMRHIERIPAAGPVLILPTHTSYLDPPLVGSHVPRPMFYLARETLFRIPLLGWALRATNVHPIRRGAGDREALRLCRAVLQAGWPLVFFPEGTRSRTGRLGPLQGGFVMILEGLDVPYVPVNIQSTYPVLPRGAWWPRFRRIEMVVGEPNRLPPRAAGEKSRDYMARCFAQLQADYRKLGVE